MSLSEFFEMWALSIMDIPVKLDVTQHTSGQLTVVEMLKVKIWPAVIASEYKNQIARSLQFWRKPDVIRTTRDIKKGELCLSPIVPLSNITTKGHANYMSLGKHTVLDDNEMEFFLVPLAKPQPDESGAYDPDNTWQAFWWIVPTSDKQLVNMELTHEEMKGIEVPVMCNTVSLKSNTVLMKYVPAVQRVSIVPKAKGAKAPRKST
jgi:hypothetical protein